MIAEGERFIIAGQFIMSLPALAADPFMVRAAHIAGGDAVTVTEGSSGALPKNYFGCRKNAPLRLEVENADYCHLGWRGNGRLPAQFLEPAEK
jgi:hypothetical protein